MAPQAILEPIGLLTTYIRTNVRINLPQTQLLDAIRSRDLEKTKSILDTGVRPVRTRYLGTCRESPIVLAVLVHSLPLVQLLLEHGAPVDEIGLSGYTPLQVACKYGAFDITYSLLDRGAKVEKYRHRPSAIAFAAFSGNVKLVTLLLQRGGNPNEVWIGGITSALRLREEVLQELVAASDKVPENILQLVQ